MVTSPNGDAPFEIRGYVTDPKRVGYQVLTNYEGIYWRALVGNEAWSLYEVLRGFCHQGNNSCHPSIQLLTTILGLKEKRVLTGWAKTVAGKVYRYPGLIEILQEHGLLVAEVLGDQTQTRYLFHVNLTPDLLTAEQVARLPALLQKKHAELVERCQQEEAALAAKRRPAKFQISNENRSDAAPLGGGNLPGAAVIYHGRGGKLPPEQYPSNNTQLTTPARAEIKNNNSGAAPTPQPVVVALTSQGIAENVARRLATRHSPERVAEKIEYLAFLMATQPAQVKNPRGWLRRAIEENYGRPDGFLSPAERQQQTADAERQAQAIAAASQASQDREAQQAAQQQRFRQQLHDQYGTTAEELAFWEQAQAEIQFASVSYPALKTLLADAEILKCVGAAVQIGIRRKAAWRHLGHPGTQKVIERVLTQAAGKALAPQFVLLEQGNAADEPLGRAISALH